MKNIKLFEDFDKDPKDPEEKYYSGHTTYQERHAEGDDDGQEDNFDSEEDDDLEEAADPLVITSKDEMRVQDILRKAKGSMFEAQKLAQTMCKLIQSGVKALRRGRAADKMGEEEIANIFYKRALELGMAA